MASEDTKNPNSIAAHYESFDQIIHSGNLVPEAYTRRAAFYAGTGAMYIYIQSLQESGIPPKEAMAIIAQHMKEWDEYSDAVFVEADKQAVH